MKNINYERISIMNHYFTLIEDALLDVSTGIIASVAAVSRKI